MKHCLNNYTQKHQISKGLKKENCFKEAVANRFQFYYTGVRNRTGITNKLYFVIQITRNIHN